MVKLTLPRPPCDICDEAIDPGDSVEVELFDRSFYPAVVHNNCVRDKDVVIGHTYSMKQLIQEGN